MSKNLQLSLTMAFNGSALSAGLNQAGASIRQFTTSAGRNLGAVRREVGLLYKDFNGFSAISKLVIASGGISIAKSILNANLEFEKTLLESKQLANMTKAQAAEMRASAIAQSTSLLATPQEVAEGIKVLANAGMKFESIMGTITEAGRAALLFRSSISEVANMDFDIQTKFKIDPAEMKKAHEIMYYHSKDGRFEAKSMSQYAPVYLNEFKNVGIGGMGGLNFAAAITQAVQQAAPATQPGEVATMIKQGLSHIYSDSIGKKLQKETGIDIKKYASKDGKFYGNDGVDGMMDLARAMKAAGLDNQFKLQKAGFREQESRTFWLQLMNNGEDIRKKMKEAEADAASGVGDRDATEIKASNFGKAKKLEVAAEKGKVGDAATKGVDFFGSMAEYAADNKGAVLSAGAAVGGMYLLNRFNKNRKARIGAEAQAAGASAQAAASALAVQQVFVTNWPAGMQSPADALKQKREGRAGADVPAPGAPGATEAPKGKWAKVMGGAGKALGALGAGASGWEIGFNVIGPVVNQAINSMTSAIAGHDASLGTAIYDMLHKEPIPVAVKVTVENGNIVAEVTQRQDKKGRRF